MASLKLTNVGINRDVTPHILYVALKTEKNEQVNVQVTVQAHQNIDSLTLQEIEHLGMTEAKKFFA